MLSVTLKSIPYFWANTATDLFPKMFTASEMAKEFSRKRFRAFYIVSNGLGPYFKKLVLDELNKPNVFFYCSR